MSDINKTNLFAIIVAGGTGQRFGSQMPKQFLNLAGKPVIMRSIEVFFNFNSHIRFILTLPPDYFQYWEQLCKAYEFGIAHTVVAGGASRFHSVQNGISAINVNGLVAIHDAVRPLVSLQTLERCFDTALQKGNAVPAIPLVDSIRQLEGEISKPVARENYVLVQTPQIFDVEILKKAYCHQYNPKFTDDASVAENDGVSINLVEGNIENIKITNKTDLALAETLFNQTLN